MALGRRFLIAFLATLNQYAEKNYFTLAAPDFCPDGRPMFWDPEKMNQALASITGLANWPLDLGSEYSESDIIEYIEGLFQIVAKPTKSSYHEYCGSNHPSEYDTGSGRYDFTVSVNRLFDSLAPAYFIQFGRVRVRGSSILDARLIEDLPFGEDKHLKTLVSMAILDYRSTRINDKWKGVRSLADAYERIKSDPDQGSKKDSVANLIHLMEGEVDLFEPLNSILGAMTSISNTSTIRHHEIGKGEILSDTELLDFLFHMYFNIIKFALQRKNGTARSR